jgi:hypothetical protein
MITTDYRSAWTRYGMRPGCDYAAPDNSRLCQVGESFFTLKMPLDLQAPPGAARASACGRVAARGCALSKDRARTGRSQKIAPGLEAFNQVRDVKPGPERSEGPAFNHARDVKAGPERSEGPASSIGPMCKREPERSEGSGGAAPHAFEEDHLMLFRTQLGLRRNGN